MTQPDPSEQIRSLVPGSIGPHLRKWAVASLNQLPLVRRMSPVLRSGIGDTFRGAREKDQLVQLVGWALIAAGVYQQWKRSQEPSLLYSAYLDMDEGMGIRVLRKGVVVGEFPVGRSGG